MGGLCMVWGWEGELELHVRCKLRVSSLDLRSVFVMLEWQFGL